MLHFYTLPSSPNIIVLQNMVLYAKFVLRNNTSEQNYFPMHTKGNSKCLAVPQIFNIEARLLKINFQILS